MTSPAFEALSDTTLLVRLGTHIDPDLNAQALALAARLRDAAPAWLQDVVPAYASLAVFFDAHLLGADAHAKVQAAIATLLQTDTDSRLTTQERRLVEIPVCYGGDYGIDLDTAADQLGLSTQALVARHIAREYTVAMIGFAPGFPYLLGLDPTLALPRLATPRTQVPAGSVAIGGAQTGIYPRHSPGGWRLLGRTPLRLFDPHRNEPALLTPGDRVRFVPITPTQFEQLAS